MNLDDLVQAAIAKALADYISTLDTMDEGFMGKFADMVAERIWKKQAGFLDRVRLEAREEAWKELEKYRRAVAAVAPPAERAAPWVNPPTKGGKTHG